MGSAQDEKADNKEGSGDTIIGEIRSLISRYPRKLLKAQKLIVQKQHAGQSTQHLLRELRVQFSDYSELINQRYATIQQDISLP